MSASVANEVINIGPFTGIVGSVASHTIYTPESNALLRITSWISPELKTDPSLSIQTTISVSDINNNTGTSFNVGNNSSPNSGIATVRQAKANEPVSLQINVTESVPGSIPYSYQVVVEEL